MPNFFNKYPYTDFHELNLDWVLESIKMMQNIIETFTSTNKIKYANPIEWNITSQYEANTLVLNDANKIAYLSLQPVPVGVTIFNTDYWMQVLDLSAFYDAIGNLTELKTDVKNTLVNAINEIYDHNFAVGTPEAYGAKGDGITDDTAAIQECINDNNVIVLSRSYLVTDTIYLDGLKRISVSGTISYEGTGYLFNIAGHFNEINGMGCGQISGNSSNNGIKITTIKSDGSEVYSYYNKICDISMGNFNTGIFLDGSSASYASYFNNISKNTLTNCNCAIQFYGFANGNYLSENTLYNCGVANTPASAAIRFIQVDTMFPEENTIDKIFFTNSTDITCFYVSNKMEFTSFSNMVFEPGGSNAIGFSFGTVANVKYNYFNMIGVVNQGLGLGSIDATNTMITNGTIVTGRIKYAGLTTPAGVINYYNNANSYAGNTYVPILTVTSLTVNRSALITITPYMGGISPGYIYNSPLTTTVYNNGGTLYVSDTTHFKVEDNVLSILTPPVHNGGAEYSFLKIKLEIGTGILFQYTMDPIWT